MRIVRHGRNVPFVIKIVDIPGVKEKAEAAGLANLELHICACGLSKHKPFCDGSHRITHSEDEGKVFAYKEGNVRIELNEENAKNTIDELPNEYA